MKAQLQRMEDKHYLYVEMENTIDRFTLMKMMVDYGNTILRMYWRSKFDYNHIELFEPKIYDAFIFCIDFIGREYTLTKVLKEFKETNLQKLEDDYNKLTETEIKDLAYKVLASL